MKTKIKVRQVFKNVDRQTMLIENLLPDINLEVGKEYFIEIKEVTPLRTKSQNAFMWQLIYKIANHEDMDRNEMEVYALALEQANAKYIFVDAVKEAEKELYKNFRAVRPLCPIEVNGKELIRYKCFIGSSRLNVKEMSRVIDYLIFWASSLGIEIDE